MAPVAEVEAPVDEATQAPSIPPLEIEAPGQLSMDVGGAPVEHSSVKLRGGKIDLPKGELKKGDVLNLLVKVQVAEVHFVDKRDGQTGEITGVERRHIAKPIAVEKV